MEKKNLDWANIGFAYMPTDMRYVSNYKDGAWDEGTLTADSNVTINECAGQHHLWHVLLLLFFLLHLFLYIHRPAWLFLQFP